MGNLLFEEKWPRELGSQNPSENLEYSIEIKCPNNLVKYGMFTMYVFACRKSSVLSLGNQ